MKQKIREISKHLLHKTNISKFTMGNLNCIYQLFSNFSSLKDERMGYILTESCKRKIIGGSSKGIITLLHKTLRWK